MHSAKVWQEGKKILYNFSLLKYNADITNPLRGKRKGN